MRISDWSSDVCSSDLHDELPRPGTPGDGILPEEPGGRPEPARPDLRGQGGRFHHRNGRCQRKAGHQGRAAEGGGGGRLLTSRPAVQPQISEAPGLKTGPALSISAYSRSGPAIAGTPRLRHIKRNTYLPISARRASWTRWSTPT